MTVHSREDLEELIYRFDRYDHFPWDGVQQYFRNAEALYEFSQAINKVYLKEFGVRFNTSSTDYRWPVLPIDQTATRLAKLLNRAFDWESWEEVVGVESGYFNRMYVMLDGIGRGVLLAHDTVPRKEPPSHEEFIV